MKRNGFRRGATFVVVRSNLKGLELGEELSLNTHSRARLRRWYRRRMIGTKNDQWTEMKLEAERLKTEVIPTEEVLEEVTLRDETPPIEEVLEEEIVEKVVEQPRPAKRKIHIEGSGRGQRVP